MVRVDGPADSDANLALISRTDYKTFINTNSTEDDNTLDVIIPALCRDFYKEIGFKFVNNVSAHTYLLEGNGTKYLWLPQSPIVSITSIEIGQLTGGDLANDFQVQQTLTTSDYWVQSTEDGVLARYQWLWPTTPESIRVVWEAGFTTVPADLVRAMCEWVGVVVKHAANADWNISSQSKNAESRVLEKEDRPPAIRRQIQRFAGAGYGLV